MRDAGSDELVYYRDTNGQWTPDKGEVSHTSIQDIIKLFKLISCFCASSFTSISSQRFSKRETIPSSMKSRLANECFDN